MVSASDMAHYTSTSAVYTNVPHHGNYGRSVNRVYKGSDREKSAKVHKIKINLSEVCLTVRL